MHTIKIIISGGVLRGPAPLSLGWRGGRAPLADVVLGRGELWLWWSSSLALRRRFTGRTLLRDVLGLHKSRVNQDPAVHGGAGEGS